MGGTAVKSAQIAQAVSMSVAGKTQAQIAAEMGVHRGTVKRWLLTPEAMEHGADLVAAATYVLRESGRAAAEVLVSVATDEDARDADRISAARSILDRVGVVAGAKIEHSGGPSEMTEPQLRARARELLAEMGTEEPSDV